MYEELGVPITKICWLDVINFHTKPMQYRLINKPTQCQTYSEKKDTQNEEPCRLRGVIFRTYCNPATKFS
jgi:hypothetical protein